MIKKNLQNYTKNYIKKEFEHTLGLDLIKFSKLIQFLKKIKAKKKKVILIGNGGSAAMSSHVSVDLTKQCKIRAINFNEADLITCYANDYGHDNWMKEAIKSYYDKGDLVILISSSGNSKNHLVAGKFCKQHKINFVTLTGFSGKNKLSQMGNLNFWLNSSNYNQIEMVHHIWLLLACDYLTSAKF
jgi:D-sedoheptulose 7-phosphate isomerase